MKTLTTVVTLVLILGVVVSCRMAERFTEGTSAGTVSSLWPDVPPFAGAQKAEMEIPLGPRLMIRAFFQGKVNFIAFTTDKSAQEVQDFYTKDRMKTAGWTPSEKGCVGDTEDKPSQGVVCLFTRKDAGKDEGLAIIVGEDDKKKETAIFYVRADLTKPSPSP